MDYVISVQKSESDLSDIFFINFILCPFNDISFYNPNEYTDISQYVYFHTWNFNSKEELDYVFKKIKNKINIKIIDSYKENIIKYNEYDKEKNLNHYY